MTEDTGGSHDISRQGPPGVPWLHTDVEAAVGAIEVAFRMFPDIP